MTTIDQQYYEVAGSGTLAERALIKARDRIFSDFLDRMRPSAADRLIDVGVSDVISAGSNVLERLYWYPQNITACGLGDADEFKRTFPLVQYVKIAPNTSLPFDANAFEIATSNAVLEHVGSIANQKRFVRELCRISRRVFITVPNRFFPVEHHTAIPFLHFTDHGFRVACSSLGKQSWTKEENLILMTRKKLWRLVEDIDGRNIVVGYSGLRLGPLSSNLFLAIT